MVPFLLTAVSYGKMTSNILKSPSARRRAKAFSTCSSNLTVVVLFHGTASTTYLQLKPNESEETRKLKNQSEETGTMMSFFYTVLIPMLNPILYTLRNKDITIALRKLLSKLSTWLEGLNLQKQFIYMLLMQIHQKISSSIIPMLLWNDS